MNVLGIVAEYNPFHNGHLYHLQESRRKTNADFVICIMSGNFVQRGEPALLDKWARAKMALSQGIDLVFELPVLYATRSAYWFAKGGILSLFRTGVVTHVSFGVETAVPALLGKIAKTLAYEPLLFRHSLREGLKEGLSFPQARANALLQALASHHPDQHHLDRHDFDQDDPDLYRQLLSSPNNVLALAYLQILMEENLPLEPIMVERKGSGYHEQSLTKDDLPSATALRRLLTTFPEKHLASTAKDPFLTNLASLSKQLPPLVMEILRAEYLSGKTPVFLQSLDSTLLSILRRMNKEEIRQITDITEGLENRIYKTALQSTDLVGFLNNLKTKRYPYTRLQRFLIHLLLNYTKKENALLENGPPYLHLLGFTPKGQLLLKMMKKNMTIPLITKGSQINQYQTTDPVIRSFWEFDVRATNLYTLFYPHPAKRQGNLDYRQSPVYLQV